MAQRHLGPSSFVVAAGTLTGHILQLALRQAAVHPSLTGCTISMPRPEQVDLDSNGKQPGASIL